MTGNGQPVLEMRNINAHYGPVRVLRDVNIEIFPGEIVFLGSFYEDFYDAEADLDLGIVPFFDVLVEDGFTTTFEVF